MDKKIWYAPNKFESYGEEEIKAVEECLRDGWLAGFGDRTVRFEERVSEIFGKKQGLFVNSGSSAILLGLCALDLPKGSEVVTPACGFSTTVAPLMQLGLNPVFCDVGLDTYVPSVEQLREVVTPETKCIILPNLIGNVPDWEAIREAFPDVTLFEDSADTLTHTKCTDISTTSFYASHVITAGGIGGMVMFNDAAHLKRALMFRDWGRIGDNIEEPGERFDKAYGAWMFFPGYHVDLAKKSPAREFEELKEALTRQLLFSGDDTRLTYEFGPLIKVLFAVTFGTGSPNAPLLWWYFSVLLGKYDLLLALKNDCEK